MTETNLWGEKVAAPQKKCPHLNAEYSLPISGWVKLHSLYDDVHNRVEETERTYSWIGQVQGRCLDCGKVLWYTSSNTPKFLKRRLSMAKVEGANGEDLLEGVKR